MGWTGFGTVTALATVLIGLSACGGSSSSSTTSTPTPPPVTPPPLAIGYPAPSEAVIAEIQELWANRDLTMRNVTVVYQDDTSSLYTLRVIRYEASGNTLYGLVTIPKAPSNPNPPVIVELDGYHAGNPPYVAGEYLADNQAAAAEAVLIYPSFRGRTLRISAGDWQASGPECQAFEGAADDTIALMNVVDETVPEADFSRVLVHGISRGGNVALLVGARDARVSVVSAGAPIVDFNSSDSFSRYRYFYSCYFHQGGTQSSATQRMVASSPLYFPMMPNVRKVWIDHGDADTTVPVSHGRGMASRLRDLGTEVDYVEYPRIGHNLWDQTAYWDRQAAIYQAFWAVPDPG